MKACYQAAHKILDPIWAVDTGPDLGSGYSPEANGISIKQPQNACFSLPMYSTDKVKDIMKVPTCPAPAINLRMQKATYISGEAGSSAQAVPLPAKNRHPIAEITKVGLTQCGNQEILLFLEKNVLGYGHQSPLSPEGKTFCIIYGLVGIPMTMLLITAVVERLMLPVNLLLIWLNNTMGHLYSPFSLRLFHLGLVSKFPKISVKFDSRNLTYIRY